MRKRTLGSSLTAKLNIGLALWLLLAITTSVIGLVFLSSFQKTLFELTSETLPAADASAKLAGFTNAMTGKVRRLATVDTQVERRLLVDEIDAELANIDALTLSLQQAEDFPTFLSVLDTIRQLIVRLDAQVSEHIDLLDNKQLIMMQLTRFLGSDSGRADDLASENRLTLLRWQNKVLAIVNSALESSNITRVRDTRLLRRRMRADLAELAKLSDGLPETLRSSLSAREEELSSLIIGQTGYINSLADSLKVTGRVRGIENQVVTFNSEIVKLSNGIYEGATRETADSAATVNAEIRDQVSYTLGTATILLLSSILVAAYFRKNLLVRLNRLSDEVRSYAGGDTNDITVQGNDEIAGISLSVKSFITEIEKQQQALTAAKTRAESATKSKSEFLATMSHEIRTPMNGVLTMTDLLSETDLDDRQKELLSIVQQSGQSLLAIINDILDFSRIEAGKLEIESVEFNLREVVDGVVALCGGNAYQKGLELYYDVPSEIPGQWIGDPTRLRQILLNLISNAVKFTEDGYVEVTVAKQQKHDLTWLHFEVQDTGIGISDENAQRLFQAFEQADGSTVRRFGGSGLGLSICKRLVELMGGNIAVESELGAGSKFFFSVPLPKAKEQPSRKRRVVPSGVLFLATARDRTRDLVAAALIRDGLHAHELAFRSPNKWEGLIDGDAGDEHAILVLDDHVLENAELNTKAKELKANKNVSVLGLLPRSGSSSQSMLELDWLDGIVAKPINKDTLCETIFTQAKDVRGTNQGDDVRLLPDRDTAEKQRRVILVAEDNIINQKIIAQLLDSNGYQYDIVNDGEEALSALVRPIYGLVLTDFHMPNMDGLMLSKAMRASHTPYVRSLPIVMLTADAQPETHEACLDAGADGFLTKPIVLKELTKTLHKWLP